MECKFVIQGELPDLNDVINKSKRHWAIYAKMKQETTELVKYSALKLPKFKNKIYLEITYFVKNRKKDMDNIAFGKKFIFDGLVEAGKIANDGWNEIAGWEEHFKVDKREPRIEVKIKEVNK